jgi:hypothetical protein
MIRLHLFLFLLIITPKIVRAAAGIEPATSRTRNENHTTRPSSHETKSKINFFNLSLRSIYFIFDRQIIYILVRIKIFI